MRQLDGTFGVAVPVAMFARGGTYASAQQFTDGFAPTIGARAALTLAGGVADLVLLAPRAALNA
jgi:hypothetical protein